MRSPIKKVEDKTSFRAVMLTVIFLLSWLEAMVPLGVPGVKFGFSPQKYISSHFAVCSKTGRFFCSYSFVSVDA